MYYVVVANFEDSKETVYSKHKKYWQAELAANKVRGYDCVSIEDEAHFALPSTTSDEIGDTCSCDISHSDGK